MNNKNGFWRKASVIITIVIIVVTVVFGYGLLCANVKSNRDNISEIKPEVKKNTQAVERMETKLEYIKEGIDDIKRDLRERQ